MFGTRDQCTLGQKTQNCDNTRFLQKSRKRVIKLIQLTRELDVWTLIGKFTARSPNYGRKQSFEVASVVAMRKQRVPARGPNRSNGIGVASRQSNKKKRPVAICIRLTSQLWRSPA